MITLPPVADLERICRGLAMLDALCAEDRADRYYSFDGAWGEGERMASMHNGSGDEWFIVFNEHRAFLKAFFHELPRHDRNAIYAGCPSALTRHLEEPAFSMNDVTFGGFFAPDQGWTLRGNQDAMSELEILKGDPETYRAYAADYFEVELPIDAIVHVLAGRPLDPALLTALASTRTLDKLDVDRAEIGYGLRS